MENINKLVVAVDVQVHAQKKERTCVNGSDDIIVSQMLISEPNRGLQKAKMQRKDN